MTILVVEDDPAIQQVLVDLLVDEGYMVTLATRGDEALNTLARVEPAVRLVILDLMLPGLTGWEVSRRIRSDPAAQHIPILILSAIPQLEQQTADLEATLVMAKPFVLDTLLTAVTQLYQLPG